MIKLLLSEKKNLEIKCFKILSNVCNKNNLNLDVKIHPGKKQING